MLEIKPLPITVIGCRATESFSWKHLRFLVKTSEKCLLKLVREYGLFLSLNQFIIEECST